MANIYYKTHKLSTFKARNGLFSQFYIGKHTFVLTMAIYPCKRIHTKKCTLGLEFGLQMPPNCLKKVILFIFPPKSKYFPVISFSLLFYLL